MYIYIYIPVWIKLTLRKDIIPTEEHAGKIQSLLLWIP